jgi:hypothetical protein
MEMISSSEENPDRRPIKGPVMKAGLPAQIHLIGAFCLGAVTRGHWVLFVLLCAAALYVQGRDTLFHACREVACERCGGSGEGLLCPSCHGFETARGVADDG